MVSGTYLHVGNTVPQHSVVLGNVVREFSLLWREAAERAVIFRLTGCNVMVDTDTR